MLAPLTEPSKFDRGSASPVPAMAVPEAPKPWRVMVLLSNLTLDGGAEVQAMQLTLRLKARGWNVVVVSVQASKSAVALLSKHDVPVLALGGRFKLQAAACLVRLSRIIRETQPHILHAHMSHAILLARFLRLVQPLPVLIGTLHGLKMYNVRGTGWRLKELINGITDRLSNVTSVVCQAAAKHYLSAGAVSRGRMRLIPNGIDTVRFQADLDTRLAMRKRLGIEREFVWLLVGRFQPVKDHCTMLRAFARVCGAHSAPVLLLAGDGPLLTEMTELAQALGIGSRVRFLGQRRDIPALMNAADACVLSSIYEAMPLVLLEAAASGLPLVATDVGGNCDIVLDGSTGYLAPAGDPEALAQAMLRLAALPPLERAAMGLRAREHVLANYDFDTVIEQWESLYTELLERRAVRP